ncbi:unnamed protein product, partial [Didymodactylos carnosus]
MWYEDDRKKFWYLSRATPNEKALFSYTEWLSLSLENIYQFILLLKDITLSNMKYLSIVFKQYVMDDAHLKTLLNEDEFWKKISIVDADETDICSNELAMFITAYLPNLRQCDFTLIHDKTLLNQIDNVLKAYAALCPHYCVNVNYYIDRYLIKRLPKYLYDEIIIVYSERRLLTHEIDDNEQYELSLNNLYILNRIRNNNIYNEILLFQYVKKIKWHYTLDNLTILVQTLSLFKNLKILHLYLLAK